MGLAWLGFARLGLAPRLAALVADNGNAQQRYPLVAEFVLNVV
jgi:hypothetical protein